MKFRQIKEKKATTILYSFMCSLWLVMVLTEPTWGQSIDLKTRYLDIVGEITQDKRIGQNDFSVFPEQVLEDMIITNHLGQKKGTISRLKGVNIKNILQDITLNEANPKLFSEYYFVFEAKDGYKVVFSWNEIFNTKTGDNIYIITSKEGKTMAEMEESILVITSSDFHTGRRYIKGLKKISVHRV